MDDPQPENDPLVGSTIGNYTVTGLLGKGGMGTVYRAEHPDIGRQVAIKVVSSQFAVNPAVMARFKAEALSVNRIGHPNIIDISDFGALSDGRPYFVMEYLDGEDLGHRLRARRTLSHLEAAPILRQTLDALAAAHAENIIHRDLKPDNIFVAKKRGGSEIVKLLDFGIAKLKVEGVGVTAGATADGTLLGTPLYMSPEQSMGRMSEIGPASDLYSMGVILYQVFTGETPFQYQNFGELLVAHASETPQPPTLRNPSMDPRLEPIILRCLAKKPGDRYRTSDELLSALVEVIPPMANAGASVTRQQDAAADSGRIHLAIEPVVPPTHVSTSLQAAPPPSSSVKKVLLLAVGAGVVLGLGAGTFLYLKNKGPMPIAATELAPPPMPGPVLDGKER
jgi:serine/threonine-protein kinase